MDEIISSDAAKSKRKKFNKICGRIRKQLEYYFSDSNLSKDKFLSELISKDPSGYVDVEVFKTFNKIKVEIDKSDTDSCLLIATAAGRSKMLEVSADHRRLRRTTPQQSKDFDPYTLYVEKLPVYANQNWVRDKFCHFGGIRSVNVPKYRVTNKIKGFAFIEFEDVDSVKKACEYYKLPSEKECSASEDENKNVKSVKKNKSEDGSDKKSKSRTRSISESSDKMDSSSLKSDQHENASEKNLDPDSLQKNKKKRKREDSDSEATPKKLKESTDENPSTSAITIKEESKKEQSDLITEDKHQADPKIHEASVTEVEKVPEVQDSDMNGTTKKKKKRRQRKKNHHRSNQELVSLRVMPKAEWKVYRNKYLELQRDTMKFLKQQLMLEAQEWKEQESHVKSMDVSEPKKSMDFVPGVIIKIKLLNPIKNPSEIKDQVKSNAVVAYIDAPTESTEVFIRCHNSDDAEAIIKEEKLNQLGNTKLLEGDEEKMYWEKIQNDRKAKYNNPVPHKKRGRDKLLAKIRNKHIFFDD